MVALHKGIEFAGLHNLRNVPHGDVAFFNSTNLCYVQTIGNHHSIFNRTPHFELTRFKKSFFMLLVTSKTSSRRVPLPNFKIGQMHLPTTEACGEYLSIFQVNFQLSIVSSNNNLRQFFGGNLWVVQISFRGSICNISRSSSSR